jgi:hypothetical protein
MWVGAFGIKEQFAAALPFDRRNEYQHAFISDVRTTIAKTCIELTKAQEHGRPQS